MSVRRWILTSSVPMTICVIAYYRSKRAVMVILILLIIIAYLGPSLFSVRKPKLVPGSPKQCLERLLSVFQEKIEQNDAVIIHSEPGEGERVYLPYVGNGKVAAAFGTNKGLYIRTNRALSLLVNFDPIMQCKLLAHDSQEVHMLDIKAGLAYRFQAFQVGHDCITIGSVLYAHRSRPPVLVQDIKITNPTNFQIVVSFSQPTAAADLIWSQTQKVKLKERDEDITYQQAHQVISIPESELIVVVVLATVNLPHKIIVKSHSVMTFHVVTVVHYSEPTLFQYTQRLKEQLGKQVSQDISEVLQMDDQVLLQEHTHVWSKLWESGFSISHSKAAGAINGDKINTSMYYVLSNVPAPLHDMMVSDAERVEIQRTLHYPDRCYSGHSTLQASTLWLDAQDEETMARIVTTWMITLENHGCSVMVKSGAEGVLQAMVLSIGALHFTNAHLEFTIPPQDLHRDFIFRRINYGNNTHLNISVIVGDDNKANLFVALDRNDRPYYACEAGCVNPPILLSKKWVKLPVKVTKPITSILYITADRLHMDELKHAIHVGDIVEAPAHEHHVMALHKHGHKFGGLPTLFWVSIAFLVIVFHLFLFKLIYNEYCQGQERYSRVGRYSL